MKTTNFLLSAAVISMMAVSCSGGNASSEEVAVDSTAVQAAGPATYIVDTEASNVRWEGGTSGAQVYSHFGDIKVKEGKVATEGDAITAASFIVDMTSITPTDENYSEEHPASDLVGHLTTGDFFLVEEFPTASFMVKSMEGNNVIGDLTIKGQTHEETVVLENAEFSDDRSMMTAKGKLTFDRQKYGVAWAHYLKDVILSDDISLEISLVGKKG